MELLTEKYKREISCVYSCYDRVIISGTIPEISYSEGMTNYMKQNDVRIFDYPKFAEPFKETIRANVNNHKKEPEKINKSIPAKVKKILVIMNKIFSSEAVAVDFNNKRYLEFISAFDNKEVGRKRLKDVTTSKSENNRNYKGFNFFSAEDLQVLMAIVRGEFNINGFRNKNMQKLPGLNGNKISRLIKRLRIHGLIKKATNSYKYYLTKIGKETIIMAQKIKELVLVPAYCY